MAPLLRSLLVGFVFSAETLLAQTADTLTNRSVIDMVVGKLPKDLITLEIKTTPAKFDITSDGLVALNNAKVPRELIKLMMESPFGLVSAAPPPPAVDKRGTAASQPETPPQATEATKARDVESKASPALPAPKRKPKPILPNVPTESGIHMVAEDVAPIFLEPAVFSSSRTSNALASALTSGIAPTKQKAVVSGPHAELRTTDASAEFYFVFDKASAGLSGSGQWWGTLTSPNEFRLVRLDQRTDRREVTTASFGAFNSQTGTEDKAIVAVTSTRLRSGVYRVIPKAPLTPGEYAFFPASVAPAMMATAVRLFDFGVDVP